MHKISTVVSVVILLIAATVLVVRNYDMNSEVDLGPGIHIIQDSKTIKPRGSSGGEKESGSQTQDENKHNSSTGADSLAENDPIAGSSPLGSAQTSIDSEDEDDATPDIRITRFFPHIIGEEN